MKGDGMIRVDCPEDRSDCKYFNSPEGCKLSIHHTVPRRLAHVAFEAGRSEEYQSKLKKVINHPSTHIYCCRAIHDLLDRVASEDLPSEDRLDRQIGGFCD